VRCLITAGRVEGPGRRVKLERKGCLIWVRRSKWRRGGDK
jgi:hypothetical protein